ncbi:Sodium:solute symporter family protein [Sulfidibacter corallicola]|uniref:Sodium:solute symporter family protein n=1 Tax=Sulfidibacter corallicola TaxID=2818388 RepID=A0A8A4TVP3_SULCO|nr:sodium:solute symporter family protein [Sulfidibacter corallicola]QTD53437.1 sodium:solute symporter family protein [Sulfidibacter corallicola]
MNEHTAEILSQTNFSSIDWVIVLLYLSISVVIGLFVRKFVVNMTDYIGAGRALGTCLGIATMTGTEMGLVTVMYSSQKGFTGGFAAFHIALVAGIVTFLVGASGFIVAKLRESEVLTIPEYYEKRFDRKTRVLGGIMLALGGILNMGLFLKVGSIFIVGVTGLSAQGWALPLVMTLLLVLVLIYTTLGGMFSVVVTDYIQFVVLSAGMLVATYVAIQVIGWDHLFETIVAAKGQAGFDPFVSEGAFGLEYVLWMAFTAGLVSCAIWPTAVARALAAKDAKTVKKQYMWSSISFMIRFLIPNFLGIAAFVLITTKSPELNALFFPTDGSAPLDNLYAMPIFLGRIIPTGIIGLISAAMIAAFMSTHDSYLLAWSSVLTQDVIAPLRRNGMTGAERIKCTRILIVVIGLYILYWGLFYKGNDDIWDYMAVTGAIYFTGSFAVLLGGLYWKRASSTGAFLALLSGIFAVVGLGPVQALLGIQISGERVGLLTVAFSLFVMVLGSLLFPDNSYAMSEARREALNDKAQMQEV